MGLIYQQIDHEVIASVSSATGFTASKYDRTDGKIVVYVLVQPLSGSIRVRCDGTPTASVGTKYNAEGFFYVWGYNDIKGFKAIDDGGTATVDCSFFGTVGSPTS